MPPSEESLNILLAGRHVAVLATIDRRGHPHLYEIVPSRIISSG